MFALPAIAVTRRRADSLSATEGYSVSKPLFTVETLSGESPMPAEV
jgi:hypothetical protein